MKPKLLIAGFCILIFAVGCWIYDGHRKNVSNTIQWSREEETNRLVPLFQVYYQWDGSEENDPTWMIFPKDGKWWVIDLRKMKRAYKEIQSEGELRGNIQKYKQEFTFRWINIRGFEPKASRGEAVMIGLGFDVMFSKERNAFFECLDATKGFDEGRLYPDKDGL